MIKEDAWDSEAGASYRGAWDMRHFKANGQVVL